MMSMMTMSQWILEHKRKFSQIQHVWFQTQFIKENNERREQWEPLQINPFLRLWEEMQLKVWRIRRRVLWKFTYQARSRVSGNFEINCRVLTIWWRFKTAQSSKRKGKCYLKSSDLNCNRFMMTDKLRF